MKTRPRNVAHRGASGLEPENTLRAFRTAEALGADGLELDLRVTADRQLVVIHDPTLERTTNGNGPVRDRTLAELHRLDAGKGERIPTFEQVLSSTKLPIQAELKTEEAIEPMVDMLSKDHWRDRIRPICFDATVLRRLRARVDSIDMGLIAREASPDVTGQARWAGATFVSLGAASVQPKTVEICRQANLKVSVWKADHPAEMRRMVRLGVDAVVIDRPDVLAQVLRDTATVPDDPSKTRDQQL